MPIEYDLKTGYPDLNVVPRQRLAEIAAELFTRDAPLQYQFDKQGDEWSREMIAKFLTETTSQTIKMPQIQMAAGAISAIDTICRYVTKPGDIVLVENPTFYFIIHKLAISHVDIMGVPMQTDGVDLDALEELCKQHGDRISLFYVIPSFHNPTGCNYSDEKRKRLVELAHQYDFTILEDSTYHTLYFDQPPPPMIREYDPDSGRVISVGSFAKLVLPSSRIGWVWATEKQIIDLLPFKATVTSTFMSQLIGEMINSGEIHDQLDYARRFYGAKHDLMVNALKDHAPEWLDYMVPNGGYFVWATLPDDLKATDVLAEANLRGIDFAEGKRAFVNSEAADSYMRLCFAMQADEIITKGTEALCACLKEMAVQRV